MRAEARDALLLAAAGATAALTLATPSLPVPLRIVAAGALGAALPGAAVVAALMPHVRWHRSERVILALGGSLAIAIGAAFVLHASPNGLSAAGWAGLLGAVTVGGGLVGWLRGLRPPSVTVAPPIEVAPDEAGVGVAGRLAMVSPWSVAMLVAAGLLVVVALVMARSGVALGPTSRFAELWMLRADGERTVRVGLANHEGGPMTYRLIVTLDGRRLGDPIELTLEDGGTDDRRIELPRAAGAGTTVEVRMWHADDPVSEPPLRQVRATIADAEAA